MRPIRIYQGTEKNVNVTHDFEDLDEATEIEVFIGADIVKTLGDGVSGVSDSSYLLTIAADDTQDLKCPVEYSIQARITTAGGQYRFGKIDPSTVKILPTNWGTPQRDDY